MGLGRQHGAVEVAGQARELLALQSVADQAANQVAHGIDAPAVHALERPRDGGHIRESPQPQQPLDERVVPVVVDVAQPTEAEQQVPDEQQHDATGTIGACVLEVPEAALQPSCQPEVLEQGLPDDDATKRGEPLILESQSGDLVKTPHNLLLVQPHLRCPPGTR